jgi:hypothetical protein
MTNLVTFTFWDYITFRFYEALLVMGIWLALFIGIGAIIIIIGLIQTYIFERK